MIVECVALLMFVNAEIKEARLQTEGMAQCYGASVMLKDNIVKLYPTNAIRVRQN